MRHRVSASLLLRMLGDTAESVRYGDHAGQETALVAMRSVRLFSQMSQYLPLSHIWLYNHHADKSQCASFSALLRVE